MGQCLSGDNSLNEEETDDALTAKQYAKNTLHSIAIFSKLQEQDLGALEELTFSAGDDIVVQGDSNVDLIYVLRSGSCEVKQDGRIINSLERGCVIGERAFIAEKSRSATVTALEQCGVLAIKRSSLEKALGFDSFVPDEASDEAVASEKLHRLSQFPLLNSMPDDYMNEIARDICIKQYLPEEPIIIKGTIGDEFYFIDRGSVDIVDGGPENAASPTSVKLSFSENSPSSVGSGGSRYSTSSRSLKFDRPVGSKSTYSKVPRIDFDTSSNNAEGSVTASAPSSPSRKENDEVVSENSVSVDDDTAEIINLGINDFLQHYESRKMQSLGGLIQNLKKGTKKKPLRKNTKKSENLEYVQPKETDWGRVKATLRAGQFFGEMALMHEESGRRTASCIARTHCTLLAMKKGPFLRLMDILNGNG